MSKIKMLKVKQSNITLYLVSEYESESNDCFRLINSPTYFMKKGGTCTVFANENIVIKRYNQPSFLHKLKQNIGLGRAKKTHKITQNLFDSNINSSEPIGYGFQKIGLMKSAEYFIAKRLDGITLMAMMESLELDDNTKKNIIIKAMQLIELLWANGWTHGDLKIANLMLVKDKVYFIDMDGTKKLTNRRLEKDKKRFLKNFKNTKFYDVVKSRI